MPAAGDGRKTSHPITREDRPRSIYEKVAAARVRREASLAASQAKSSVETAASKKVTQHLRARDAARAPVEFIHRPVEPTPISTRDATDTFMSLRESASETLKQRPDPQITEPPETANTSTRTNDEPPRKGVIGALLGALGLACACTALIDVESPAGQDHDVRSHIHSEVS